LKEKLQREQSKQANWDKEKQDYENQISSLNSKNRELEDQLYTIEDQLDQAKLAKQKLASKISTFSNVDI